MYHFSNISLSLDKLPIVYLQKDILRILTDILVFVVHFKLVMFTIFTLFKLHSTEQERSYEKGDDGDRSLISGPFFDH